MNMALRYYFDLMSQPSRAVYIFLKQNNIPFDPKPVALRKGEHFTEEFKKLNPFSRVPFIDDNGFILTESVAILRYLSQKYNVPEHWYPRSDIKKQSRVDQYLNWQHLNLRLNAAMTFQHLLLIPLMRNKPVDQKKVERFKLGLAESLMYMETYFLKDQMFLCGDDISVADILGACELMQLNAVMEEKLYESNPVLDAWMKRVKARLQPNFDEAHQITYRTCEIYKKTKDNLNAKL
ncbi:hypothetical protein ACJMK2_012207 [Sinanodonta woodiana]|uniref:Glutathione transferase n=1 Tax=Sinanodonta woodiana TaxID=1069815 RepID=A0ABD3V7H5_SINWO